ncbi:iron-containing alcohol dehydrogenase [Pseudanabaena sp. FACHB-2040]|uniref:3-dehydroquinate synthase family protein n=1 Tax=Pseudanabaena sp. FACHB-2040 TaxID=2692859 RepID=UPI00168A3C99|nr:iron-containing alcohol dehydrogenase [Pseudanabaena sp. FACHB-2040]MBD2257272.1 iron-containing alcohol dehydrogenase [Pseudanabaena sp. FACHB-2040]
MADFFQDFKFEKKSQVKIYYPQKQELADFLARLNLFSQESANILITDENLAALHLDFVLDCLANLGIKVFPIVVPASEDSKSLETYGECISKILNIGIDKYSSIVSFGGGVVNNLAGFIASTLYRGIQLVHIPTTLLSQADAAVDVKQAINSTFAKNSIGSYYPPTAVIICVDFLNTLPERFLIDGFAEVIKHALCQDYSFYQELLTQDPFAWDPARMNSVIRKSVSLKLDIMSEYESSANDPFLYNEAIKQYGHALGHAIEHASENEMLHGEAIAIGMAFSAFAANKLGLCSEELLSQHVSVLKHYRLPFTVPAELEADKIIYHVKYDKHYYDGKVSLGLLTRVGEPHREGDSYFSRVRIQDFASLLDDYKNYPL